MSVFQSIGNALSHAWSIFNNKDPTTTAVTYSSYSGFRPWVPYLNSGPDNSIAGAIYNRIALDVTDIQIRHVKVDEEEKFESYIKDSLDNLFTQKANTDQISEAFIQDLVLTMFHNGVVAIVPTYADESPDIFRDLNFKVEQVRVGEVLEYKPDEVKVRVYRDTDGQQIEKWLPKKWVPIIQNPFYSVMNKPNSIGQRLIRKLSLLDYIDNDIADGKWNILVKMPYATRTDIRKKHARERINELNEQLKNNPLGIGYMDSAEQITQLNRPIESGLLEQVSNLQDMFFSQLGMTMEILNGTADEDVMTNYYGRTVEPVVKAITKTVDMTWISKEAREKGETMRYFRDPFKLVSASRMADISDKYTRNEILSSNEVRGSIGKVPDKNKRSDELLNKNISHPEEVTKSLDNTKEE